MQDSPLYTRNTSSDFFIHYCEDLGIDIVQIAARFGKTLKPGIGFHFEDFNMICDFFEELSRESDDPFFGLNWAFAQPDDFRHSGPVVYLANRVSSWRGFIDIGIDYVNTFTNGFRYSFNEYPQDDIGILECKVHPLARPCRQFLEHHLATIAQMAQRALPDIEGFTTNFQHDGDASHPIYEKAFRGTVNFNAGTNSIHVPLKYLERKVVEASPLIRKGLKTYLNFRLRLAHADRGNISAEVSSLLPGLMGVKNLNLANIAELLQISPKKLQRLLAQEQKSFTNIVDETRQAMATRYLCETNFTLSQIASILDYSSQETFIQAFYRWHRKTPKEFRNENQHKGAAE